MKLVCEICGWVYDPAKGAPPAVPPGTEWDKVPSSFVCPECGSSKDLFAPKK